MDFFKIKPKHILCNGFSLLEIGALIKMQALTAHLERIPTDEEMRAEVTDKARTAVAQHLQSQCTSLAEVLHKVCEDVATVAHKRREGRARKKKSDNNAKKRESVRVTTQNGNAIDKIREDKIREDKTNSIAFVKPTIEQVSEYCRERGNTINADQFINHYESKGWMIGKNKMKDWKASVRTWENKRAQEVQKGQVINGYTNGVGIDEYKRLAEGRV